MPASDAPADAPMSIDPADLELLELGDGDIAPDGRSGGFTLVPGLVRHDGALYGGTGLAASVVAMEAALGRDVIWASTQFVHSPSLGARIDWTVDVLAEGRRSAQLLVRGTCEGAPSFTTLGSVGIAREDGLTGQYATMPEAAPPETARPWDSLGGALTPDSWIQRIDLREAELADPTACATALWVRRRDGRPLTPAAIAFAADFVPLAVARAAGKVGAGSSLDNSMRFRPGERSSGRPGTEWALLQLDADFAFGGYGHGRVTVWGQDGTLVASGSQSAAMKYLVDDAASGDGADPFRRPPEQERPSD